MGVQEHDLVHLQAIGEFAKQFSNFFFCSIIITPEEKRNTNRAVKSITKGKKLQTSASCDLEISTRVFAAG